MKYADVKIKNNLMTIAPSKQPKPKRGKSIVALLVFVVAAGIAFYYRDSIKASFNPISIVANITGADLKESDGRTNILLLGSDKRDGGPVTSVLTDTILIASIGKVDNDVVLISLPRDLWIAEYHDKINAIYSIAERNQKGTGPQELSKVIAGVTGIPIHYYALVTFDLFTQAIDALGGITVKVDNSFTDYYYPVAGKENAPDNERYITVHFDAGGQTMNGEKALQFVRSRHGDGVEGTDFARAKRQQKIIAALKDKALSLQTLVNIDKIKGLYDAYANNVDTNIDFPTVERFYLLTHQIDLNKVVSIVLQDERSSADEGGLLYAPQDTTLYNGAYVLLPKTGDFTQIHAYVQRYLFGNK